MQDTGHRLPNGYGLRVRRGRRLRRSHSRWPLQPKSHCGMHGRVDSRKVAVGV